MVTQSMGITCEIIAHGSPAYREMVALRYLILRQPLGLSFASEQLAAEANDVLIAAYIEGKIVGSLILTPHNERIAQMRQVAVATEWRRHGVGNFMVMTAEQQARERGVCEIVLHSREAALPFYERLGYEKFGDSFLEVGLPHHKMRKMLR